MKRKTFTNGLKFIFFAVLLIVSTLAAAQKKLTAVSIYEFAEDGTANDMDSLSYIYTTAEGLLYELKPSFGYTSYNIGYYMDYDNWVVHSDSSKQFHFTGSLPLTLWDSYPHILVDGLVTETYYIQNSDRRLYEYNANGQVTKNTYQSGNLDDGTWVTQDSVVVYYDELGNKVSRSEFRVSEGFNVGLFTSDTIRYMPGTSNISEVVSFQYSIGPGLEFKKKILVTYEGTKIDYIDIYERNDLGELPWTTRIEYSYTGDDLNELFIYEVVNDTPSADFSGHGAFTYTEQAQIASYTLVDGNETVFQDLFEYDSDGFITKHHIYNALYDFYVDDRTNSFYYGTITGISELEKIEAKIFPNPASDKLTIETEGVISEIEVLSLDGKMLINQKSGIVDVAHLSSGMYILIGKTDKGLFRQKFMKE